MDENGKKQEKEKACPAQTFVFRADRSLLFW